MHVNALPPGSAVSRKRQGTPTGWGNDTELLARVVDGIEKLTYYTLQVNGNDADPPVHIPRPNEEPIVPETVSFAEFGDLLKED